MLVLGSQRTATRRAAWSSASRALRVQAGRARHDRAAGGRSDRRQRARRRRRREVDDDVGPRMLERGQPVDHAGPDGADPRELAGVAADVRRPDGAGDLRGRRRAPGARWRGPSFRWRRRLRDASALALRVRVHRRGDGLRVVSEHGTSGDRTPSRITPAARGRPSPARGSPRGTSPRERARARGARAAPRPAWPSSARRVARAHLGRSHVRGDADDTARADGDHRRG